MKKVLHILFFFLITNQLLAQKSELANSYFEKGEFSKAVTFYEEFYKEKPFAQINYPRLITCYQELKSYQKAEKVIKERIEKYSQYQCYVDLGYNYQLQNNSAEASKNYEKAISLIKENQNYVYGIAREFENKVLVDYAIQAYELAITENEHLNFDYQLSLLYGQKGDLEKMTQKLLDYANKNQNSVTLVQNMLARYMNEDAEANFSNQLRKSLLSRVQNEQDIFWNHFLSWYFVQQQDYEKAFVQERAIFKREGNNINKLISLTQAAVAENKIEVATEMADFVLNNTIDVQTQIVIQTIKNKITIKNSPKSAYNDIKTTFENQIQNYGITKSSIPLVIQIARFDGFELNNFNNAKAKIDQLLKLPLSAFEMGEVKGLLADLYLSNEKFNQAIVYYAQIQDDLKNHEIGHEAQFKMALTSYFKTDFDWAQKQFKVLKQSTSLLIANDALDYFLLINDVTQQDTVKVSLTKFAKADFLKFKKQNTQAQTAYTAILKEHAGEAIEDVTLYRLAQVNHDLALPKQAIANLELLLQKFPESLYRDDAYFLLGNWYSENIDLEKAKQNFENIIINHQNSIYFLEAQTKYRKLRGDQNI